MKPNIDVVNDNARSIAGSMPLGGLIGGGPVIRSRHLEICRKVWKFALVKRLHDLGYSRSDVLNLFKFVDWAMILPEGLKRAFWEELKVYEEERQMPYVTSVEQIGYDRGLQDGEETGVEKERRSLALKMLQENIQIETIARITGFTIGQFQALQAEVQ